ncbi:MAG TPA: hypothetical protein VIJ22_10200, partial [Polyangiaceae bacterium]
YHRLPPEVTDTLAIFKVYEDGKLVAVIREPMDAGLKEMFEGLLDRPIKDSTARYRVDCLSARQELKDFISKYLPTRTFEYHADPAWTWNDNGTYEGVRLFPSGRDQAALA